MLVLYDADCGLCSRTAQALRILDRRERLRLVPLQRAPELLGDGSPPADALKAALHVRGPEGDWWTGGEASLRIAAAVPALWPLAQVGRLPLISSMVEPAYRLLARHRDRLGRLLGAAHCRFRGDQGPP
jgi:predicted DCC family thiol-disulfide oxidoreductase YuxK